MAADKLKPQTRGYDFPDLEMPEAPVPAPSPSAKPRPPPPPPPAPASAAPRPGADPNPQDYFGGSSFDADHFGPSLSGIETDPDATLGRSADIQSYFGGSTFDADFDEPARGALDAALEPSSPRSGAIPRPGVSFDAGPAREALRHSQGAKPAPAAPPPRIESSSSAAIGRSAERASLRIDEVEVRLLADYGPVPSSALLMPLYTFRVASRQRRLRGALRAIDARLRQAEQQRDELLAQLFSRVRRSVEEDSRFAAVLGPVRELDLLASERSQALARSSGEYQQRVATFDGQIVALNTAIAQHTELLKQQNLEHERHDEAFRRAEARSKRLYIEIRSATELAIQAGQAARLPAGTAPQEHVSKIQALEQQALAMRPVLDELRLPLEAAMAALTATRAEIEQRQRAVFRVEEQKRSLAQEFGRQLEERAAGVGQAQGKLGAALAEAGRAVLGSELPAALADPSFPAIRQADEAVLGLTKESEKYVRALDAYDRAAVKNGFIVLGVGIALVLVLIALLIAL